jgi:hypothetical protein
MIDRIMSFDDYLADERVAAQRESLMASAQ